jgi:hypothetical protein
VEVCLCLLLVLLPKEGEVRVPDCQLAAPLLLLLLLVWRLLLLLPWVAAACTGSWDLQLG